MIFKKQDNLANVLREKIYWEKCYYYKAKGDLTGFHYLDVGKRTCIAILIYNVGIKYDNMYSKHLSFKK